MEFEFTKKEYLALLKAIYLADCVTNAHAGDSTQMNWDISRLRRKIFSRAAEAGFADLVRHDAGSDDHLESEELAEEMDATLLRQHVDSVFWNELVARYTDKIMDQKFGSAIDNWGEEKYQRHRAPLQEKVEAEIQANGLKNVFILGEF